MAIIAALGHCLENSSEEILGGYNPRRFQAQQVCLGAGAALHKECLSNMLQFLHCTYDKSKPANADTVVKMVWTYTTQKIKHKPELICLREAAVPSIIFLCPTKSHLCHKNALSDHFSTLCRDPPILCPDPPLAPLLHTTSFNTNG